MSPRPTTARTTTRRVAERAGVSQGAQTHRFSVRPLLAALLVGDRR